MVSTLVSLLIANSQHGEIYHHILSKLPIVGDFNLHMIINDFLMAIFFLFVGLEIKNEILNGHLSSFKKASFPIIGAIGGVLIPAVIFLIFNANTDFSIGIGIPISTDIAFAIGIFMILKNKLNPILKIFLLSLAVVDDLISILVIGLLYSSDINIGFLILSALTFGVLILMNRRKIDKVTPYMIVGMLLWIFVYSSGIHATISGVLIAIAIPSKKLKASNEPMMNRLEHKLAPLCNLVILPLFALANTAINLNIAINFNTNNTLITGIVLGLVIGKPLGIMMFTWLGTKLHVTEKPEGVEWISILPVSLLAGIGFTMSIFVSEIAFGGNGELVNICKISILSASIVSILATYLVSSVIYAYKPKMSSLIEAKSA
ncbi:Na+/H+ antiporter NhaA [Paraclostridium bifermentans]|uniref:Na(+)/H(+) antiporter NhaA n=1 Tax=Paraclostridium bifermentans TaxID=1490 RepID=A0AA44DM88_PARBF|nr:Na+/H+ antiporter NhaA [Paraclostridium bifermentans]MBN8048244.1 Na+/H+ antiporter NhaA [Paraclostridium bifermentans]NME10004.1 Na+/H+ antiporter NhaA [Paraclostridium bifermentans]